MNLSIAEAKAPFVQFEMRAVEDRAATLANGSYTTKDVAYSIITPAGSKDRYEKEASEWFAGLMQNVREERFPQEWLDLFTRRFEAWKKSEEMPVEGTPIKNWPVLSPSQRANCLAWHILTVEQLAAANEEVITRLGMGGRSLVQQAKDYLQAAGPGKVTLDLDSLRTEVSMLKAQNDMLIEQNTLLKAMAQQMGMGQNLPQPAAANSITASDLIDDEPKAAPRKL